MTPSLAAAPGLMIYPVKARASGADTEKEVALKASVNAVNDTKSGPGAGDTSYSAVRPPGGNSYSGLISPPVG